jgi:plasmid stabilization system protein ParE
MKLRYTRRALTQLSNIYAFITHHDPEAAARVLARIRATARMLTLFPMLGHDGAVDGTLELTVPGIPYVVVYRIEQHDSDQITIIAVYHGRQKRD